ncbi:WD40-repeat-containing domain protein [Aspergillus transmontanensis]|uniref:WD40-repeat-containing domain protein n=1 Tax=Aspergillus transmontanensis TaxID=1034304 RepID=A0A5N6VFC5_9EURO|nr:WD40-repeat-containing domain protein [Aspergillus transmontanensis]
MISPDGERPTIYYRKVHRLCSSPRSVAACELDCPHTWLRHFTMSKQYLSCGSADNAHPTDIFSLAVTDKQILSASGVSALKVHSTSDPDFPLVQSIDEAHKLGCHHVVTDGNGLRSVSVGFGGEIRVWSCHDGNWSENKTVSAGNAGSTGVWAIALSGDGQYLAGVSQDGHIRVWDLDANGEQIRYYETKGSFGTCIDLSADGRFIASGHENGSVYIFSTETGRMPFSLSGLVKPVRAVAFSPGGKILAAAGDSNVIVLYDTSSGEQVANLPGHSAWVLSLSWSHTGEYLLSGSFDGKVKVWSIDTRTCVATHSETERAVWNVKWLPKIGKSEGFATAGASRSISFYREATGG